MPSLDALMNRQDSDPGYMEFTQWLGECLGLSPDTSENYFSAVNCVLRSQAAGMSLEDYFATKTPGWERTCYAAWKHYLDWCRLYMEEVPRPLGAMTDVDDLPEAVVSAVNWMVVTFGVSAIQRLRWTQVGDNGTQVFDAHGSPQRPGLDSHKVKRRLHRSLTELAEHFTPASDASPVVPLSPGSLKPSNRARLRAIQARMPKTVSGMAPKLGKLALSTPPMPTQDEMDAAQAHFPQGFTPGQGAATGRPPRTREELAADSDKPIEDWAVSGLSAELTGHFPADPVEAAE